ncbi:MAG: hypothetical protein Q8Q89_01600 [bacterium]|nr:hypothetical protein [bacterium]
MSNETDNEYQVRAAAQSHKWRWPSDMHKCGTIKTNTKDGMILLLVLFQKLFRNNYSERPLMALYGFSVAVSGLLIFFVGSNYWGNPIGFWLMMLYLLSVWPWQTALYGGHIGVATMAFLASVLTIQQITPGTPNFLVLIGVGILFCFMIFSSGSSIKYIPLFFAALFTSKFYQILLEKGVLSVIEHLSEIDYRFDIAVLISIGLLFIFLKIAKEHIINLLYDKRIRFIRHLNMIQGQELFSREHYYKHADKKLPQYFKNLITAYVGLSVIVHLLGWSYIIPFLLGFSLLFFIFTLPDIKLNTKNYLRHVLSPARKTRFEKYVEYFVKRGMNIPADFRSPILQWLPRVSWRIAPFQTLLLAGLFLITFSSPVNFVSKFFILLISLLPVLWGELTRSTRSLRTYGPSLMGILVFLGYASSHLALPPVLSGIEGHLWSYLIIATGMISIHQVWLFFTDVYPARMAIPNLIDALDKYNIREFYTYETSYNDALANAINIERSANKKYKIHYMDNLSDVKEGWIVIPPTNSWSISMEATPEAMNGDYTKDPELNELLATRKIEKLATAKFRTFSSSKIWPQEADVATYVDLILREVDDNKRFRGYAWLINAEALAKK